MGTEGDDMNAEYAEVPTRTGVFLIKMAVVYLLLGVLLGLGMASSGQYQLSSIHTHINLLGWVTLALPGQPISSLRGMLRALS